jgi:phage tail-like protein
MAQSAISRYSKLATDPLRNFRFIVEFRVTGDRGIAGSPSAGQSSFMKFKGGFTTIDGLGMSIDPISYREGGMNTSIHQMPGRVSFQPLTMSRGVILGQTEAINWFKQLFAASSGEGISGVDGSSFRCDMDIFVLDHPATGSPLIGAGDIISKSAYKMKFTVHNAFITGLSYSNLSAADNALMYENMTLMHEGLSVQLANYGSNVSATQTGN